MRARAAVLAALVLVLGACSSGSSSSGGGGGKGPLLDSTDVVCTQFAEHAKAGLPRADRADVVASMGEVIDNADAGVRDAFAPLQRTVGGSDGAYRLAADGFAQACFDAGWKG